MARGRCTFKQQDVTRALRATKAAGITVQRVEIDQDGKIAIVIAGEQTQSDGAEAKEDANPWHT